MKTFLSLFVLVLLSLGGSTAASAQGPYFIASPVDQQLEFSTFVGESQTLQVMIIRVDPNLNVVNVTTFVDEFTSNIQTHTFTTDDTLTIDVTFTPTTVGTVMDSLMFTSPFGYTTGATLTGKAFDKSNRFSVNKDTIDYSVFNGDYNVTNFVIVTNHTDEQLNLTLSDVGPEFTTIVNQQATQLLTLPPKGEGVVSIKTVVANMVAGRNTATLSISDGQDIDGTGKIAHEVHLTIYRYLGDGPLVEAIPKIVDFERDPQTGIVPDQILIVRNLSTLDVLVTGYELPSDYEFVAPTNLPVLLPGGADLDIMLRRLAPGEREFNMSEIIIIGRWLAGGDEAEILNAGLRYVDTLQSGSEIRVKVSSSEAEVGQTSSTTLTTVGNLPSYISACRTTLVYNSTVLVPQSTPVSDTIIDGLRYSTFEFSSFGLDAGSILTTIDFTVALGNATNTTVTATDVTWLNFGGTPLLLNTVVDAGVVSVENADGFIVNPNAGPLKLSASPLPASDVLTVSYERGAAQASLRLFDATGTAVGDFSYLVSAQLSGTAKINVGSFPTGVYFLHFSSGPHTFVSIIPIE